MVSNSCRDPLKCKF